MSLSDGLFFISVCVILVTLLYKLFTFFEFTKYSFWENLLREGAVLIMVIMFGSICRVLTLLNVENLVYVTLLNVVEVVGALIIILQAMLLILSLKTLNKRNEAQTRRDY